MSERNRLDFEVLTNFDASTLTGTYQAVNGTGTVGSCLSFKFYNSSASLVILSFNGVDDQDFVPPGGTFIFDAQTNARNVGNVGSGVKELADKTIVYAKTSSNTDRLIMAGYK